MPKNMFQRPAPITRSHSVPRHGAPLPQPAKSGGPRKAAPATPAAELPSLAALLKGEKQP